MTVEILIHVKLDKVSELLASDKFPFSNKVKEVLKGVAKTIHGKTDIIDCGKIEVDHNCKVFDMLAPFDKIISFLLD